MTKPRLFCPRFGKRCIFVFTGEETHTCTFQLTKQCKETDGEANLKVIIHINFKGMWVSSVIYLFTDRYFPHPAPIFFFILQESVSRRCHLCCLFSKAASLHQPHHYTAFLNEREAPGQETDAHQKWTARWEATGSGKRRPRGPETSRSGLFATSIWLVIL